MKFALRSLCLLIIARTGLATRLSTSSEGVNQKQRKHSFFLRPLPLHCVPGRFFYDPFASNSRRHFYYPRSLSNVRTPTGRIAPQGSGFVFPGTALCPPFDGIYTGNVVGLNPTQAGNRLRYRQSLQTPALPGPPPPMRQLRDCDLLYDQGNTTSGVMMLSLMGRMVEVYCDMNGIGNNWLVFHRREDDTEDFYKSWSEYERGFGNAASNYWLGLFSISDLFKLGPQTLRVELQNSGGSNAFAEYSSLVIRDGATNYRLEVSGYTAASTAGDALRYHNGFPFTTFDRDNDNHYLGGNCAVVNRGAWWYNNCYYANLNGEHLPANTESSRGIVWFPWNNNIESLQRSEMRIKPNY